MARTARRSGYSHPITRSWTTPERPFKVVKFASDVTERKLLAADTKGQIDAIKKSQAVIEFQMDGTIKWANPNFLSAVGYVLGEIEGKHHGMFVEAAERTSPNTFSSGKLSTAANIRPVSTSGWQKAVVRSG